MKEFLLKWIKRLTISFAVVGLWVAWTFPEYLFTWTFLEYQVIEWIFGFVRDLVLVELKKLSMIVLVVYIYVFCYLFFQFKQKKGSNSFKDFLLKYRKTHTFLSAGLGLWLAWAFLKYEVTEWIFGFVVDNNNNNILTELKKGLFLIVLATLTSYYLWFLRNEDKLIQLEQQKESNRFNSFSTALKLFTEKNNIEANAVGLKLLMKMRYMNKVFDEQIDLATPYKDLRGAKLSGADLTKVKLMGTNLTEAKLISADMSGADLTGTFLTDADLTNADLTNAVLNAAGLIVTDLTGANLTGANLSEAYLMFADLTEAYLSEANLSGAYLIAADLTTADLTAADLTGADLTGAYLTDAYLTGADLTNADLTSADLTNADLTDAILTNAILTDVDLTGANLIGVNLNNVQILIIWLTINKQDFPNDDKQDFPNYEIDLEFLKKDFGKVSDPMDVAFIKMAGKYYLEKIKDEELEEESREVNGGDGG